MTPDQEPFPSARNLAEGPARTDPNPPVSNPGQIIVYVQISGFLARVELPTTLRTFEADLQTVTAILEEAPWIEPWLFGDQARGRANGGAGPTNPHVCPTHGVDKVRPSKKFAGEYCQGKDGSEWCKWSHRHEKE